MDNTSYKIYNNQKASYQYACSDALITTFCSQLADGTITGFDIAGLFADSNDYVISIMYFPINIQNFVTIGTNESIVLGKQLTALSASPVTAKAYYTLGTIYINKHFGNFLDFAPYTKFTLSIPYFEKIDLDPSLIYSKTTVNTLYVYMSLDTISGKATVYVYNDTTKVLVASKSTQLGIVVPLGKTNEQEQTRNNILQGISLVGSLGTLALGASTGNGLAIAGGLALATKTTVTAIQNNVDKLVGYNGLQGSRDGLAVDKKMLLITERPIVVSQPDVNVLGKPCMKTLTLSSLTYGYCKVSEIHFNAMGYNIYQTEIDEIVALLKQGVKM